MNFKKKMLIWVGLYISFFFMAFNTLHAQLKTISLSDLTEGQKLNGFSAIAVYLNDAGQPMGGRFIHERTGFTLDLLQIESVPQTFIWVNTFPVSGKGEPHTQEHLLITKGNKGHELNTREGMSLAVSNAFTSQLHTAYNFYTGAGVKVFYNLFEKYLDALLYPDYTAEEVNREVRNWGVSENPDKTLKIEEKGSVYNEMTTSMTNPYSQLYDKMGRLVYGNAHPLSFNAGGDPAGIRELGPAEIQHFHDANYYLWNMGAITSLPRTMALADILAETNIILNRLDPDPAKHARAQKLKLPPPQPAEAGKIVVADYPGKNEQGPGNMLFTFPAERQLNATEELLLANFMSVFAGDANTNLYKKFIDSKTREIDLGAQSIYGYVDDNMGQPVFIGVDDIASANLTTEKAELVRQKIMNELLRIASFKDNSPELKEFNNRFRNSLTDTKRNLAKFVNTPPKFGFRNTYDSWYSQLDEMSKIKSFRRSIILKPQFDEIEVLLATGKNFWKDYLATWKLTTVTPYAVITKASAALIDKNEADRKDRVKEEIARLKIKYNVADDQAAILKYKAEYDNNTAILEKAEQSHIIKFIDNPPLTLDDELDFKKTVLPGNINMLEATFNNMTSATTGIALKLDGTREDQLVYLAILPELIRETGVIKDGKAIDYETMTELLRQEILALQCSYSTNFSTGRAELLVKGSGNNVDEAQRAIKWMTLILQHPNWSKENLSRIRDLVDQNLAAIRKKMQGAEEDWVSDPKTAYMSQQNPLLLSTTSFLTRSHNIFRLKWMLKDAGDEATTKSITAFLKELSTVTGSRDERKNLLGALQSDTSKTSLVPDNLKDVITAFNELPVTAKQIAGDASKDLEQVLNDIPDNSLQQDWAYLCDQMSKDLSKGPERTLAELEALRKSIMKKGAARMFMVSSGSTQQKLNNDILSLVSGLDNSVLVKVSYGNKDLVDERVKARLATTQKPVFVGLMNPNSQTGVFMNSAKLVSYNETNRESLLRFLAAGLYGGGGKQSVYTKTTGAGLSYSTGVGTSLGAGLFNYYAERTPELPQTLRFVIDEIKRSPVDPSLGEYVIAGAFRTRAANDYEGRVEAMAADITDGYTPDVIRHFRSGILELRKMPNLVEELYKRKDIVYEKILPGYGIKSKDVEGGIFYVIGNEKQMTAYEAYLQSVEGSDTKLYRIYPRDYWITGK
ncbi:MAG: hypothetical protein ABI741_06580 [Ferruginibacter sp.]